MMVDYSGFRYFRGVYEALSYTNIDAIYEEIDYGYFASYSPIRSLGSVKLGLQDKTSAVCRVLVDDSVQMTSFSATSRNEVRRTLRDDEYDVVVSPQFSMEFWDFYAACEAERGWMPAPKEELLASEVVAVRFQGKFMAGMAFYEGDTSLRVTKIFSRRKSSNFPHLSQSVFSACSKRTILELLKIARSKGLQRVDLGGIDMTDPAKIGISKFKLSMGAEPVPVYLYSYRGSRFPELREMAQTSGFDIS